MTRPTHLQPQDPLRHLRETMGDRFVNELVEQNRRVAAQVELRQRTQSMLGRREMIGSLPRTVDPFEQEQAVERNVLGDEWASQMDTINRAFALPDGGIAEDIGAMAIIRQEDYRKQDAEAKMVFINPVSARKGVLGGAALMVNGVPPQRVINWSADRFDEATVMTLDFAVTSSDPTGVFSAGGAQNRPFANVYFLGGRGVPSVAQVDIGKGTQITIAGSFCAVDIGLDVGNATGAMNLGAWLSFFSAARQAPALRTKFVDGLANAGGTTVVVIPAFATGLLPIQVTDAAPNLQIDVRDRTGTIIYTLKLQALGQQVATIPISDDAYDILLTNTGVAATTSVRLVFQLAL